MKLKTSTRMQLCFAAGMVAITPGWWLAYQLPMFINWPLWVKIAFPSICVVLGLIWFRQCMSPDKTSFRPKWK